MEERRKGKQGKDREDKRVDKDKENRKKEEVRRRENISKCNSK